jgi:AcrR family transcriptional regulator
VSRVNRARLLESAVASASELGASRVSVKEIVARAEVSRGTFYALFADRDSCLAAVLEDLVEDVEAASRAEAGHASTAADRIERGLAGALRAADTDPRRLRCCAAAAARHEPRLLAAQERAIDSLTEAIAQVCSEAGLASGPLADARPPGVIAAQVLDVVRAHLDAPRHRPLITLYGELMSVVAGPHLTPSGAGRAALEPPPAAVKSSGTSGIAAKGLATQDDWVPGRSRQGSGEATDAGSRVRLTRRTREVLESLRAHPGESNRGLARHAGGVDAGQISKLLRRLEDRGLITNHGEVEYSWSANSWFLTDRGRELIDR